MATERIDIVKDGDQWVAKSGSEQVRSAARKADLVKQVAQSARQTGAPTSVRIHGRDGRIQEERTYGRGADPRRRRG